MMAPINNPHDTVFKQVMRDPKAAIDFLDIHLPPALRAQCELSTLKVAPGSFIDENSKHLFSDMLYSVSTTAGDGYIYCLVEHQSRPDKFMAFRLVRYAMAAMAQHLEEGHKRLPLVIPVLFYHGETSPYPYPMNWLALFDNPEVAGKLYHSDFPLVDVTVIPDDEILQNRRVALMELVQKHIRTRDWMVHSGALEKALQSEYTTEEQVEVVMKYMLSYGETGNAREFMDRLITNTPQYGETLMNIAKQLEQYGRQEGIQIGEQKGRQEEKVLLAQKLFTKGFDIKDIAELTGLSHEELAKLPH